MVFFDPVDPSTESLLSPGRVGFRFVAPAATSQRLLLEGPPGAKRKPSLRWMTAAAALVVRGTGTERRLG